jgi:DNA-binding response OmpR family regulator
MSESTLAPPRAPAPVRSTEHTILIIDDEAAIRESLETLLALEGYRVDTAIDGEIGLDRIGGHAYDLILLDLALPGRNGSEILGATRICR